MLIEQNIELESSGPRLPGRTCTSITGQFHKKQNSLWKIFKWIIIHS